MSLRCWRAPMVSLEAAEGDKKAVGSDELDLGSGERFFLGAVFIAATPSAGMTACPCRPILPYCDPTTFYGAARRATRATLLSSRRLTAVTDERAQVSAEPPKPSLLLESCHLRQCIYAVLTSPANPHMSASCIRVR